MCLVDKEELINVKTHLANAFRNKAAYLMVIEGNIRTVWQSKNDVATGADKHGN